MINNINMYSGDILLIVDLQTDFCPGGTLPVADGEKIVPRVNEWIAEAGELSVPVYASRDWHPKGHISFKEEGGIWPPHCIQDSIGAGFHKDLLLPEETVIVTKGVRFDKDQNSAFDDTGLGKYLKIKGIERLFICGLALDVCVMATVMDSLALGFKTVLILNATKPVNKTEGDRAVDTMKKSGAVIINPDTLTEEDKAGQTGSQSEKAETPFCTKAPEWAEHQRFEDDDEPCDDGRESRI